MSSDKHSDVQMSQPTFYYAANTSEYPLPPLSGTSSPPPAYVSAIRSNHPQDAAPHFVGYYLEPKLSGKPTFNSVDTVQPVNSWAYKQAEDYDSISELAGDTVCMSGTNSSGPVDPYALHDTPLSSERRTPSTSNNENLITELLGSLSFASELPGSDPVTPCQLPELSRGTSTSPPRSRPSPNYTLNYRLGRNIPELPAIPMRRPVPSHSVSEPGSTASEMPSTPLQPQHSSTSLSSNSYLSVANQNMTDRRRSSSPAAPNFRRPKSTSDADQQDKLLSPDTTRPNSGHERPLSLQIQRPASASRSARMYRQKEMLDLLENIEL
jgi:hypothetical protein